MISTKTLKAVAIALPLSLGVVAPAIAGDYNDRYEDNYRDRDRDRYDRDYDRGRHHGDHGRYDRRREFLSPGEITYRLRARGYSRIHDVRYSRRSGHYHAVANDTLGSTFRLSVSAYSGRVTNREYLYGPQYRTYNRDYYDRYY